MSPAALREKVWDDIQTLPENALQEVREFVLFKKTRARYSEPVETEDEARARRVAAFERLRRHQGKLDREVNVKEELTEAYYEMYQRSL